MSPTEYRSEERTAIRLSGGD